MFTIFTLAYQDWKLCLAHVFSLASLEDIQLFGHDKHIVWIFVNSWNYNILSWDDVVIWVLIIVNWRWKNNMKLFSRKSNSTITNVYPSVRYQKPQGCPNFEWFFCASISSFKHFLLLTSWHNISLCLLILISASPCFNMTSH